MVCFILESADIYLYLNIIWLRTYIDTHMNAQKELVLDNYKKDSKAAYET